MEKRHLVIVDNGGQPINSDTQHYEVMSVADCFINPSLKDLNTIIKEICYNRPASVQILLNEALDKIKNKTIVDKEQTSEWVKTLANKNANVVENGVDVVRFACNARGIEQIIEIFEFGGITRNKLLKLLDSPMHYEYVRFAKNNLYYYFQIIYAPTISTNITIF